MVLRNSLVYWPIIINNPNSSSIIQSSTRARMHDAHWHPDQLMCQASETIYNMYITSDIPFPFLTFLRLIVMAEYWVTSNTSFKAKMPKMGIVISVLPVSKSLASLRPSHKKDWYILEAVTVVYMICDCLKYNANQSIKKVKSLPMWIP